MIGQAALFKAVGVGIGEKEAYEVALAMKSLGEDTEKGVESVRFFGKFFGLVGDYYVFEATLKDGEPEPEQPEDPTIPPIEHQDGPNAYSYFVCNRPGGPISKLPQVTPEQIRAARKIKQHFTGNLDADVSSFVPFPGKEGELLRAQIARIQASTVLAPKDYYVQEEEEEGLNENEEFSFKEFAHDDFTSPETWQHHRKPLLGQGRATLHEPPEPEDEDAEPIEIAEEDKAVVEGGESLLASAENDEKVDEDEGIPQWAPLSSTQIPGMKHGVGGVKNLLWPGAYTVASSSTFANIYVGYGLMNSRYKPVQPPPLQKEYTDPELQESSELPAPPPEPEPEEGEGEGEEEGEENASEEEND